MNKFLNFIQYIINVYFIIILYKFENGVISRLSIKIKYCGVDVYCFLA